MPTSGQQARAHLVNNGREMAYSIEMTERDIFPCFHENSSRQAALQASCSKWFKQHLETQLRCVSETSDVAPECLRALDQSTLHLSLLAVLDALSQGHDTSLDTLLRQMRASLPTTVTWAADYSENENSSDDNTPLQLVFLLLGWLSMLYKPAVAREPGMLEMVLPETSTRASRFQKYGPSTATTTSSISETSRIPFPHLFASFGRRVPEEDIDVQRQTTSLDSPLAAKSIIASNIYYSNLSRVGKLKIDWVPDISQHLELDERNRSLRLFASPSFCALICLSDPQSTYPLNRYVSTTQST
ncbi:hypothetical protein CIB48_g8122 [Xylaria polymorpha]|nr:hypothetical protein CIB48_g8122 [Xylaria polymorpha]